MDWSGIEPGVPSGKPATNCLKHGMVWLHVIISSGSMLGLP